MSYDVSFRAKLEGVDQYVSVGSDFINHTSNTSLMIKEVCGDSPPSWNGMTCSELIPILDKGITLLKNSPQQYRTYEPGNGWGTVETTIEFLHKILSECREYPTAIVRVSH